MGRMIASSHKRKRQPEESDNLVMTTGPAEPSASLRSPESSSNWKSPSSSDDSSVPSSADNSLLAIPTSDFSPTPEEILRFSAGVSACAVISLHDHQLHYNYEPLFSKTTAPSENMIGSFCNTLSSRLPSGISLQTNDHDRDGLRRLPAAFGEMKLRRKGGTLRDVGLAPDPLTPFASLASQVDSEELVEVRVAWEPLSPRRAIRWAKEQGSMDGMGQAVFASLMFRRVPQGRGRKSEVPAGLLYVVVSVAAYSAEEERAQELARDAAGCFAQYRGASWFEPKSVRESVLRKRPKWDGQVVTTGEIGALLLPPKASCPATNTPRSGGYVADPPQLFVPYRTDDPDVLPWGKLRGSFMGTPKDFLYFGYDAGHSGSGKTQRALSLFLHLVRNGIGAALIDPDRDGIERAKRWLGPVADRVIEVNLRPQTGELLVPGWNPISVSDASEVEGATADVVDAFSAALNWGTGSTRAKSILMMSTQSLCELALRLPSADHPTVFQIPQILHSEEWRMSVVPHLSPLAQHYWLNQFPDEPKEAKAIVARAIYVLASSPAVSAFLGSSESSYSARRAMDDGSILLVCPKADADETTRILTNLIVSDLVRSALSRDSIPEDDRREFWAILDELEELPAGMVIRALNHARKYKMRLWALSQGPAQLDRAIWDGLGRNASALVTSGTGDADARLFANRWGKKVAESTIMDLPSHEFVGAIRIGKEWTNPHRFSSVPVEELWGPGEDGIEFPAVARYTPDQVREAQSTLSNRIVEGLGVASRPRARTRSTVIPRAALPEGEE